MSRTPGPQQELEQQLESTLSFTIPASPSASRDARRVVASAPNGLEDHLGRDGLLLLTELVNNAVIHGSRAPLHEISIDVLDWGTRVRVEVRDDGSGFSWCEPPSDPDRASGYGLVLVEAVADRWGIDTSTDRTCVWFEL
jgi:anti-sigma regulatory factor (Ser/Thr protein kinase)